MRQIREYWKICQQESKGTMPRKLYKGFGMMKKISGDEEDFDGDEKQ